MEMYKMEKKKKKLNCQKFFENNMHTNLLKQYP